MRCSPSQLGLMKWNFVHCCTNQSSVLKFSVVLSNSGVQGYVNQAAASKGTSDCDSRIALAPRRSMTLDSLGNILSDYGQSLHVSPAEFRSKGSSLTSPSKVVPIAAVAHHSLWTVYLGIDFIPTILFRMTSNALFAVSAINVRHSDVHPWNLLAFNGLFVRSPTCLPLTGSRFSCYSFRRSFKLSPFAIGEFLPSRDSVGLIWGLGRIQNTVLLISRSQNFRTNLICSSVQLGLTVRGRGTHPTKSHQFQVPKSHGRHAFTTKADT